MDARDERLYRLLTSLDMPHAQAMEQVVVLNLTGAMRDAGLLPHGAALTRIGVAVLGVQRKATAGRLS